MIKHLFTTLCALALITAGSIPALAAEADTSESARYDGRMIVELLWGLFETAIKLEDAQDRAAMHKLALLMAESLSLDSWIAECGPSKI